MSSDLVLLQPEGQAWWKGGHVPFRTVELSGRREVMVNVTQMLGGVGKVWSNYKQLKGTEELVAHAESVLGIPRTELVQTIQGGDPRLQGTWAIKMIALDAAAWASTPLRWWMLETALAKLEGRSDVTAPGSAWSLQTVADFGRSVVLLAEGQQAQQVQLDMLTQDMKEVKAEVKKTDLDRVCERRGIPHPSDWCLATEAIKGAVIYLIRDPHDHTVFYVGESGVADSRLVRDRGKHEAYRYFGMKGMRYETVSISAPSDQQDRINMESELTAAAKPAWQYHVQQEEKHWSRQFKTHKHPLHNYTASLLMA